MIVECPGCKVRYDVTGRPPGTDARCRCGTVFRLPEPDQSAQKLSCPGCGATVPVGTHECSFCRAELLLRACPRCFGRVFHGARYCDQCGAEVTQPATADLEGHATPRNCPRCQEPILVAQLVGDVLLDECPQCRGVWLDASAVERVIAERSRTDDLLVKRKPVIADPVPAVASERMYLSCPDCETLMNRVNFGRCSGVIVDVCRGHGTWFDASELPRVVEFVTSGGLERAAARDLEDQRTQARQAKTEATTAATHSILTATPTEAESSSIDLLAGILGGIVSFLSD